MTSAPPGARLWTRPYALLCLSHFLIYAHEGVLVPTLPLYVTALGGSEVSVGLVITAYAAASFLLRPLLGYWIDRWHAAGVMLSGALLATASSLALLAPAIPLLALANAVRGVGWGAANVGGNTLLAHLAPADRRGEASTYYTLFQTASLYAFPLVGVWLVASHPAQHVVPILVAVGCCAAAAALAAAIPGRSSSGVASHAPSTSGWPRLSDLLDRPMLLPAALVVSWMVAQPAVMAYAPLYARDVGVSVEALSLYYVASGATVILARLAIGPLADRVGHGPTLVAGFVANVAGLLVLAAAPSLAWMALGGVLSALGPALNVPAATALAIDRADPRRRGVAMASFTMAFQAGPAIGGVLWGATIVLAGYRAMYLVAALTVALGLALTLANWRAFRRHA